MTTTTDLDNVLPNKNGSRRKPWFFLLPSYWGIDVLWKTYDLNGLLQECRDHIDGPVDNGDHVAQERRRACTSASELRKSENSLIRVLELRKTYTSLFAKRVRALKGVSFIAERGQVLCLLGHNGASKTTLINQLVGLLEPTSGTITVFGRDIRFDMDHIRSFIGCCPQHDILFDNLTAYEHMDLFSQIRGVSLLKKKKEIHRLLKEVGLYDVRNKRASTFSGGMKRRLSFAIAVIGDPELVILDEPSTGLSVEARRHMWALIYRLKKNKAVILTSHSMEECEKLADKVVIMATGQIHAVGSTIDLKRQFSTGYTLSVVASNPERDVPLIDQTVRRNVPHCQLVTSNAGSLIYSLRTTEMRELIPLVKEIERLAQERQPEVSAIENGSASSSTKVVKDWSISGTSLEEVYLHVTKESNFARGTGMASQ